MDPFIEVDHDEDRRIGTYIDRFARVIRMTDEARSAMPPEWFKIIDQLGEPGRTAYLQAVARAFLIPRDLLPDYPRPRLDAARAEFQSDLLHIFCPCGSEILPRFDPVRMCWKATCLKCRLGYLLTAEDAQQVLARAWKTRDRSFYIPCRPPTR